MINSEMQSFKFETYLIKSICIIIFALSVGYYYLGEFRYITGIVYLLGLILILVRSIIYNTIDQKILIVFMLSLMVFFLAFLIFEDSVHMIYSFRLFYGYFLIFILLRYTNFLNTKFIIISLSVITIFEYSLIRIYPDLIFWLNNYDGGKSFYLWHTQTLLGGVHSFGGNRTVNGVLMLALHIYSKDTLKSRFTSWVSLIAMIISVSGTAYILYFIYLIIRTLRSQNSYGVSIFTGFFLLPVCVFIFFYTGDEKYFFQQFSYKYFLFIFEAKMQQIRILLELGNFWFGGGSVVTGASSEMKGYDAIFGDFMILELIKRHGLFGFLILTISLMIFMKKQSALPVFIIFLGSAHYHVLFSGPGQFITAWLLVLGYQASSVNRLNGAIHKKTANL